MPDEITLDTVKQHNKPNDLWVVIDNKVYNLTKFRSEHPGGEQVLDDVAGSNATKEFNDVGHSADAKKLMEKYFIGNLAAKDCKTQLPLREIGIIAGAAIVAILAGLLVKKAIFSKRMNI